MNSSGRLTAGRVGSGDSTAKVCEIPYDGGQLVMVLVVPERAAGLPAVLAGLNADWRTNWNSGEPRVRQRPVILSLPKWTARKPLGLNAALESLGMKQAFVPGEADLSGMDGTRDLFVSAVVHEGFVEGARVRAGWGCPAGIPLAKMLRFELYKRIFTCQPPPV